MRKLDENEKGGYRIYSKEYRGRSKNRENVSNLRSFCLDSARKAGLTNNLYFSRNFIKRHFVLENLNSVLTGCSLAESKAHILDFGPGFGILLPALSRMYDKVTALDVDRSQMKASQSIVNSAGITNVSLVLKSPSDEFDAFGDHSFSAIVADNVLEHMEDPTSVLPHFIRILKNAGLIVLSLPSEGHIYRFFENPLDGHLLRTKASIDSLLSNFKSRLREIASLDSFPFFLTRVYMIGEEDNNRI